MPEISDPRQLLVYNLGSALTMEQTVREMLRTFEQRTANDWLKEHFARHREETDRQIRNIEYAFSALVGPPQPTPSPAVEGLQREAQNLLQKASAELLDAIAVSEAVELEHHEISVYEGLIATADALGDEDVGGLLRENLEQEQHMLGFLRGAAQHVAHKLAQAADN